MPIKTVSLETAKLLKDAGFKHNTACAYTESEMKGIIEKWDYMSIPFYPAPTSDELLEELPKVIMKHELTYHLRLGMNENSFNPFYYEHNEEGETTYLDHPFIDVDSLPEALAQMWLYLNAEGLLNAKR